MTKETSGFEYFGTPLFGNLKEYFNLEAKVVSLLQDWYPYKKHIFITARYRTGSSYLYSLFSSFVGIETFYEPLHPYLIEIMEKDFLSSQEDKRVYSHTFEGQYFEEYKTLCQAQLRLFHSRNFSCEFLVATSANKLYNLRNYLEFILTSSTLPKVLQFNRVDYRLGWLRQNFSEALIVNLRRNSRDIYVSHIETLNRCGATLKDIGSLFHLNDYVEYVCKPLIPNFFMYLLDDYEKIYLLSQLSNVWADNLADVVLEYEALINNPLAAVELIFKKTNIFSVKALELKRSLPQSRIDRVQTWKQYHEEDWYAERENRCESILAEVLGKSN